MEYQVFESKNHYWVPELRPNMLYDGDMPYVVPNGAKDPALNSWRTLLCVYGNLAKKHLRDNIVCFFADDYKFETCYRKPERFADELLDNGVLAAMTPNFSIRRDEPLVLQLMSHYKTMRCWRYRQERWIKVIPSLNFWDERTYEFCILGLPKVVPFASIEIMNVTLDDVKLYEKGLNFILQNITIRKLLVYGTRKNIYALTKFICDKYWTKTELVLPRMQRKVRIKKASGDVSENLFRWTF